MKKNVLAVINTHESFELENFETLKRYCPNPSFELFGITRFESAEKLFPIFGEAHLIPTIKSNLEIEKYASLLEEELSFDRQFIIDSDFLSSERFSINKIDCNDLAMRIVSIIELIQPDYVMLGHPDNWIATSVAKICELRKIKSGYAVEILPMSNLYFSSVSLSLHNVRENAREDLGDFFQHLQDVNLLPLKNLKIGRVAQSKRIQQSFATRSFKRLINILKSEIWTLFFMIRDYEGYRNRWKYVYRKRLFVDLLYRAWRTCVSSFTYIYLFYIEREGAKIFHSLGLERRVTIFLHSGPEAAQLWYGRDYVHQRILIKEMQDLLDSQDPLFIKEHPAQDIRFRSIGFYQEMRKKGVHFIPRRFSISKEFRKYDIVVTINGSVALEASSRGLFCLLADVDHWYTCLPNVFPLNGIGSIQNLFNVYVENHVVEFNIMMQKLLSSRIIFTAENDLRAQWVNVVLEN